MNECKRAKLINGKVLKYFNRQIVKGKLNKQ